MEPSEPMSDDLHQELQRHAASVRSLARDLLRDPHAAEDVAQQTLAKAWTSRNELQPGPLGGWLQRTVTNFTRQWRRGERRRLERETRHAERAAKDGQPSPAEVLARREALQSVTDAVLQLDEPYQTVVFLRYFEDLPPRAIAKRTDSNVATVKSRLARGLAQLRERMSRDGRHEWRPALAVAFGLPLGSIVIPVTTGVLVMKTSMKVAAAAAVLCFGGWMLYDGGEPAPPIGQQQTSVEHGAARSSEAPDLADPDDTARTTMAGGPADDSWLAHPYAMELHVHVVDPLGVPIKDYRPRLAPPHGALRYSKQATDADGDTVVSWNARQPRVEVDLHDPRGHRRRVVLEHGKPTHVTLLHEAQTGQYVVYSQGSQVRFLSNISSQLILPERTNDTELGLGIHPHAQFGERSLVSIRTEPEDASSRLDLVLGQLEYEVTSASLAITGSSPELRGAKFRLHRANPEQAPTSVVEGIVFGEDGRPCAKVPVMAFGGGAQPLERARTDDQGRYRIEGLGRGEVVIRAGGDRAGLGSAPLLLTNGLHRQDVHLKRDACVRGVLLDGDGEPIAEATVEWYAEDGSWADRTMTDAHGTFVLANLPNQRGTVMVWAKGNDRRFPIAREPSVLPGLADLSLTGALGEGSTLTIQPTADDDCDLTDLRLRVRHVASDVSRGIRVPRAKSKRTNAKGQEIESVVESAHLPWQQQHLPAGFYEVEMWLPGCGAVSLGRHWIDGKADCDLGTVPLPRPGRVHFETPTTNRPKDLHVEITSLRQPFDVRVDGLRVLDTDLQLPPGDYVLSTQRGHEPARFERFSVERERTTTLRIGW